MPKNLCRQMWNYCFSIRSVAPLKNRLCKFHSLSRPLFLSAAACVPHPVNCCRLKYSIRVSNLSKATTEQAIKSFYSQYGLVLECNLILDKDSKESKGVAYVKVASKEVVSKAMDAQPHEIDGKKVRAYAAKEASLIVEGLSPETTEQSLWAFFANFGFVHCSLVPNQPVAFVTFAWQEACDKALLAGPHIIDNQEVNVRRAAVKEWTLFALDLPEGTTDDALRKVFARFGDLEMCQVKRDKRNRDCGLVAFTSQAEFDAAILAQPHSINGTIIRLEPAAKDRLEIFVGGLSSKTTEQSLTKFFSHFGLILRLQQPRDKETDQLKNVAYVIFSSEETVSKVLAARPLKIDNKPVLVKLAVTDPKEECSVYLEGLSLEIRDAHLKKYFSRMECPLIECEVKRAPVSMVAGKLVTMRSRGFAYISFDTVEQTQKVLSAGTHRIKEVDVRASPNRRAKERE